MSHVKLVKFSKIWGDVHIALLDTGSSNHTGSTDQPGRGVEKVQRTSNQSNQQKEANCLSTAHSVHTGNRWEQQMSCKRWEPSSPRNVWELGCTACDCFDRSRAAPKQIEQRSQLSLLLSSKVSQRTWGLLLARIGLLSLDWGFETLAESGALHEERCFWKNGITASVLSMNTSFSFSAPR